MALRASGLLVDNLFIERSVSVDGRGESSA